MAEYRVEQNELEVLTEKIKYLILFLNSSTHEEEERKTEGPGRKWNQVSENHSLYKEGPLDTNNVQAYKKREVGLELGTWNTSELPTMKLSKGKYLLL